MIELAVIGEAVFQVVEDSVAVRNGIKAAFV